MKGIKERRVLIGLQSNNKIIFRTTNDENETDFSLEMDYEMAMWLARELTSQALRMQIQNEREPKK